MFKRSLFLAIALAALSLLTIGIKPAAACQAGLTVTVNDYNNQVRKGARFSVFEQVADANGQVNAGQVLASGVTDQVNGSATVSFNLTEGLSKYAVKVVNPTFDGFDFWYFNQVSLTCDQTAQFTARLSAVKLRVTNYQGLLQKNVKYTIYGQEKDFNGDPVVGKRVGASEIGQTGEDIIYLPDPSRAPGLDNAANYLLEIKNSKGLKFYQYNISPTDGQLLAVNYRFSDMVVRAHDAVTGAALPNIRLNLFERLPDEIGGYKPGRQLDVLTTDENGEAYYQYPAGNYILQFTKTSGEKASFYDIVIKAEDRVTFDLNLTDYAPAKCAIKSTLKLSFRDSTDKTIGNLSFNLYEEQLNADGEVIAGMKIGSGQIDSNGLGKLDFSPQPAKQYLLQVCDKSYAVGCFWFKHLNFDCADNLTYGAKLGSAEIILRNDRGQLLPGQKFKIYLKAVDVDGKTIIDKNQSVGVFTIPAGGRYRLYLADRKLNGDELSYLLTTDYNRQEVFTEFASASQSNTVLEYVVGDPLKAYRVSQPLNLRGRILLQVEGRGEAWYINPKDNKRYYLGRPTDAWRVMQKLSLGATNVSLNKIKVNLDLLPAADQDTDGDGLPDVWEQGLLTNPLATDTDGDGFDDLTELRHDFNPSGPGSLSFDKNLASQNAGKILLQAEGRGEAWYVNPLNLERYYLSRPSDAFAMMRSLALGITNVNLNKIAVGSQL